VQLQPLQQICICVFVYHCIVLYFVVSPSCPSLSLLPFPLHLSPALPSPSFSCPSLSVSLLPLPLHLSPTLPSPCLSCPSLSVSLLPFPLRLSPALPSPSLSSSLQPRSAGRWWAESLSTLLQTKDPLNSWRMLAEGSRGERRGGGGGRGVPEGRAVDPLLDICGVWGCLLGGIMAMKLAE